MNYSFFKTIQESCVSYELIICMSLPYCSLLDDCPDIQEQLGFLFQLSVRCLSKKKCGYAFSFQAILLLSVSNKVDTMTPPLQPFLMPFASTEDPTLLFPTSAKVVIMHISVANILAGTSITCPRPQEKADIVACYQITIIILI